jgi:type IV pilus assembly protein PilE
MNTLEFKKRIVRPLGFQLGFTLIELMIAVAVIGILTAIAFPSYKSHLVKSRRSTVQTTLLDLAQRQQLYLMDARRYATSLTELNVTLSSDVTPYYSISVAASEGPPLTFTVTATPVSGSSQYGDVTLSIDQTGLKTPANTW